MNTQPDAAPALADLPLILYAGMWFGFWVLMFLLGLREYLRLGGLDMVSLTVRVLIVDDE